MFESADRGCDATGSTILLVEDDASVREMLANVLERQGFQVLSASSGEDALAIAEEHSAEISLLLTDVIMPNMTGPELAEKCVSQRPGLRVLFISGFSDDHLAHNPLLRDGVARFLPKPFSLDRFLRVMREILEDRADRTH